MQARALFLSLWAGVALCPISAAAGPQTARTDLGVARVSVVKGDVATRRGDSGDWIATTVNSPIVEGDSVRTTDASRAEVQLSPGNFVRVVADSEAQFVELGEKVFRVRVIHGTALYSELPDSAADIDIETPFAAVRPQEKGRYRIQVGADSTLIEVREGRAEIAMERSTSSLTAGQAMTLWKGSAGVEFTVGRASNRDGFDRWAANRDRELRRSSAYRYVSRDIYGVDAFDDHGSWRYVSAVGHCWFPRVPAAWVPYRHGHWTWIDYYGWNWVPYASWGWATSHWGRWHYDTIYGWGWYPGSPRLRHIWRPALVSFIGAAIRGAAFGHIGWVPLAPGELYWPWYGRSIYGFGLGRSAVANTIVVDNSVNIVTNYRYARGGPGGSAVSYLEADQFGAAGANTPRGMRLAQSARGVAIRGPLPVVPSRASQGRVLPGSSSSVRVSSSRAWNRASVSQLRDGTARVSFDDQRKFLRSSVDDFQRRYDSRPAAVASSTSTRAGTVRATTARPAGTAGATTRREQAVNPSASPLQSQRRGVAAASAAAPRDGTRPASPSTAVAARSGTLGPSGTASSRTPVSGSAVRAETGASARTSTRVPAVGSSQRPRAAVSTARTPQVGARTLPAAPRVSLQTRLSSSASGSASTTTSSRAPGPVFAPRNQSRVGVGTNSGTTLRTSRQGVGTRSSGTVGTSRPNGSSSARASSPGARSSSQGRVRPSSRPPVTGSRSPVTGAAASPGQRSGPAAGTARANRGVRQGSGSSTGSSFPTRTRSRISPRSSSNGGSFGTSRSQRSTPSYRRPTVGATSSSRRSRIGSGTSSSSRRSSPSGLSPRSSSRTSSGVSPRSSSSGGSFGAGSGRSASRQTSPGGFGGSRSQRSTPSYRRPTVGATSSSRSSRTGPSSSSSSRSRPTFGSRSPSSGASRSSSSRSARPSSSSSTRRSSQSPGSR